MSQNALIPSVLTGKNIFLLEDDVEISIAMKKWLETAGCIVDVAHTGSVFQQQALLKPYDLFLFDWSVPEMSGLEALQWLRSVKQCSTPAIFITSRDAELDVTMALNSGADDYIVKPVRNSELIARSYAVVRRAMRNKAPLAEVKIGVYRLVPADGEIFVDGNMIDVTDKEFRLAYLLFTSIGVPLSRPGIIEKVWGTSTITESRTLDTHMYRLRKKLSITPQNGFRLGSIHSVGYRLEQLSPLAEG
jgi:two-component system, OmpR family, response regulator RegX3